MGSRGDRQGIVCAAVGCLRCDRFLFTFPRKPVSKTIVHVCNDPVCAMAGSEALLNKLSQGGTLQDIRLKSLPAWGCANTPLP